MPIVIRFSAVEERKALPILLRHSPGTILPDRTYVLSEDAVRALEEAGIRYSPLAGASAPPHVQGEPAGERI
jgi:hypothetical protein